MCGMPASFIILFRLAKSSSSRISDLDLCLAHRTLLLPSTQRICRQSRHWRGHAVPTARSCPSDELRLLLCNRFLSHCSNPPPSAQILQPQSECYPLGTGSA